MSCISYKVSNWLLTPSPPQIQTWDLHSAKTLASEYQSKNPFATLPLNLSRSTHTHTNQYDKSDQKEIGSGHVPVV